MGLASQPIVLRSRLEMQSYAAKQREQAQDIFFVPTMGALHAGHAALLLEARKKPGKLVLSIFVNPAQFGPQEDLAKYPRTLEADLEIAKQCGVDVVFAPDVHEIYPAGFSSKVTVGQQLAQVFEGAARPGHFDGVCLVVLILLNIVQARAAYFGMKDYQQVVVLQRFMADIGHPTELIALPTVRDHDGLALSSRNRFLVGDSRTLGSIVPFALSRAWTLFQDGERDPARLVSEVRNTIAAFSQQAALELPEPTQRLELDYVECLELGSLHKCSAPLRQAAVIVLALRVKVVNGFSAEMRPEPYFVRLLDNLVLSSEEPWPKAGTELANFFLASRPFLQSGSK